MTLCKKKPWDSEFFGFSIGQIEKDYLNKSELKLVDEWASKEDIKLIYYLLKSPKPDYLQAAEDSGYKYRDLRLEFDLNLKTWNLGILKSHRSRKVKESDLNELKQIASKSYGLSRFYHEPIIGSQKADKLFEVWIDKNFKDEDTEIFILEESQKVGAFFSAKIKAENATIELVGVSEQFRGKGLGQELLAHGLAELKELGLANIFVVTQGSNVAAQRLYQKMGFMTANAATWLHKSF